MTRDELIARATPLAEAAVKDGVTEIVHDSVVHSLGIAERLLRDEIHRLESPSLPTDPFEQGRVAGLYLGIEVIRRAIAAAREGA